jgi:uncharacterized protein
MRIVVVGASGRVGRQVVADALEGGHEVRALVRNPGAVSFPASPDLHVVRGDILEPAVAEGLVRGADAVVVAVGGPLSDQPVSLRTDAARAIVAAMEIHGVHRLVLVASAAVLPDPPGVERVWPPGLAPLVADHRGAWEIVSRSGLDWTVLCPPDMADGPRSGRYRHEVDRLPAGGTRISTADVADFVRAALASDTWRQARVGLAD